MSITRPLATCFLATLFILTAIGRASATPQDAGDEIRRELATLRLEVQQLRAELDAVKARQSGGQPTVSPAFDTGPAPAQTSEAPRPSLEMLQTQIAELAQAKVESTSRMPVRIFGTIHTNVFANSGAANWLDNPNLVGPPAADGRSGTFSATLRQTRVGVTMDGPTIDAVRTSAVVAMDFFGGIPGFQTGQVMGLPRLLVAFARLEGRRTAMEVGQDHMLLAPRDPTSLAALAFPALFRSGNLYLRTPQVRVERSVTSRVRIAAGIVAPIGGDVPGEEYRFVPPALGGERSRRPGLQGQFAFATGEADATRVVNLGLSGHYGWERRSGTLADSWAAAFDFALRRNRVGAAGEMFVGDNIDAFGGALGLDSRAAGGWAELQVFPSERLSINTGAGLDAVRGGHRAALPRRRNTSAYGNLIFSLTPEIQASLEYRWLATLPGGTSERRNHHVDWVLAYKF